jgi:hypothetical protein
MNKSPVANFTDFIWKYAFPIWFQHDSQEASEPRWKSFILARSTSVNPSHLSVGMVSTWKVMNRSYKIVLFNNLWMSKVSVAVIVDKNTDIIIGFVDEGTAWGDG